MGLLRRLGCSYWTKTALINSKKDVLVPFIYTRMVFVHQGIIPDTLLYRFFNFFRTCPKYRKLIVQPGNCKDLREKFVTNYGLLSECEKMHFKVDESRELTQKVSKLPLTELLQFIVFLSDANVVKHSNNYKELVRVIDNICCEKIPRLPVEEAVRMNYCILSLVGTRVKFLKSFNLLMDHFMNSIKENLKIPVVVLMIFCSGIARKDPKAKEIVFIGLNCICDNRKQMLDLSTSEMILISEVAFKTSSKIINPTFIEHLVDIVANDVSKFAKDPEYFVVVIKTMRHNKNHNWNLLKSIQKCLVDDKNILKTYNFAGKTHLIALYADALYGDQEFLNYLMDSAINSMFGQDTYNPYNEKGKGRAKDIARLLWATSYLGFKINDNVLEKTVLPVIMEKITSGVYSKQLSILIDTVLSLWVMGYKPLDLLPVVFTKEMKKYLNEVNRVRYNARLQLLSTCISIESPEAMDSIDLGKFHLGDAYDPGEEKLLKQKPFLKRVFQDVRNALYMSDSIDVTCAHSVPYLNIPGILLTTSNNQCRNSIHIEVLDDSNCLYETDTPSGLMLLKLRLLRKLGHKVILVNYRDYRNQQSQLMTQIEDEIMDTQGS